ncbi:unnamed protein product [Amoebophrya sp. A120]|nr:unnamed protein product [Amoebophrya sp. A120]|eukprot:GSA120T00001338001.1
MGKGKGGKGKKRKSSDDDSDEDDGPYFSTEDPGYVNPQTGHLKPLLYLEILGALVVVGIITILASGYFFQTGGACEPKKKVPCEHLRPVSQVTCDVPGSPEGKKMVQATSCSNGDTGIYFVCTAGTYNMCGADKLNLKLVDDDAQTGKGVSKEEFKSR